MGAPAQELPDVFAKPATPRVCDFTAQIEMYYIRDAHGKMHVCNRSGIPMDRAITTAQTDYAEPMKGSPGTALAMTRSQQRARARRRLRAGERLTDEAFHQLYKPVDEWDAEELAHGRPRNAAGNFKGFPPKYIPREVHERALERFKIIIKQGMNVQSLTALKTVQMILESEETDNRGKPIVTASAKLDAAKFLLEHIVGKPTQPMTSDVSVKLQGILGTVMVNPDLENPGQYTPAHVGTRGDIIDAEVEEEDDDGD